MEAIPSPPRAAPPRAEPALDLGIPSSVAACVVAALSDNERCRFLTQTPTFADWSRIRKRLQQAHDAVKVPLNALKRAFPMGSFPLPHSLRPIAVCPPTPPSRPPPPPPPLPPAAHAAVVFLLSCLPSLLHASFIQCNACTRSFILL
jgi:hypothetical protein